MKLMLGRGRIRRTRRWTWSWPRPPRPGALLSYVGVGTRTPW
ncbi:hypothetical protein QJS66_11760 [Kocuria rhizophila]|nr:hypothetical protein QJS66_11760 [Kocuria rhizophila]